MELSIAGLSPWFEFTDGFEMISKTWNSIEEVPYCLSRSSIKFEGHMYRQIDDLNPILSKITRLVAAIKSLRFALLGMFPMIKVPLSGVELTFEAILAVFHGHLVWHLGGIMNGDCVMDFRRMFLIRYIGPLNSKHTSSVSFSMTPLPSSLTFI